MSSTNRDCANFWHILTRQSTFKPPCKMAGFPCRALLTLTLMTIIFLREAATSIHGPVTQVVAIPGSSLSNAGTTAPRTEVATQSNPTSKQPTVERGSGCPNCNGKSHDNSEDSPLYNLRIEMIKAKILSKLQMDKPPVIKHKRRDSRIAELLANLNLIQDNNEPDPSKDIEEESLAQTTKIIVFSEKVKASNSRSRRHNKVTRKVAFQFKISPNTLTSSVISARMWLNKRKTNDPELNGKILHVKTRLVGQEDTKEAIVKVRVRKSGWVVLDLKTVIQEWFGAKNLQRQSSNSSGAEVEVELSCENCMTQLSQLVSSRGRLRPFLVINMKSDVGAHRRTRRSSDCENDQLLYCCRQKLFVNFTKIGWDWILVPHGFRADFCEGPCDSGRSAVNGYTYLLQEMQRRNGTPFSPCCSPTKMSAISILYFNNDDGNVIKTNVPDMRVDSCGCS